MTGALDLRRRDALLARIGLHSAPAPDAEGLRAVTRAFIARVPYEDLAVQLGESEPLDPIRLTDRVLQGGRGGYCFEANTVLHALLETLGFRVERRQGIVGEREARARGDLTNHMALVVHTPSGPFIADAGLGEGPFEPLALRAGTARCGAFTFPVRRSADGWWVAQHEFGSYAGFWFADAPASLDDFQPHHRRLSTSPDSTFVQTLAVQRPYADRIVSLRARTLFVDGPGRRERHVVASPEHFAQVLGERFGIDPLALGGERLARLWAAACAQHERHEGSRRSA